jgi:transcriptional regulator with XRE-family HTH domain
MNNIRLARKTKGFTQDDVERLAKEKGLVIPRTTLSGWERGIAEPRIKQIVFLADIFGCSTDFLLGHNVEGKVEFK